ncbi:MAG TPA: Fe-S cluster assembly protein HesB [Marmoricola sp.]|nr:Fe-S cluster assembly protein HesB [Marmoricola sp.]
MLTLTPNASAVVKQLVDQIEGQSGLRISQDTPDSAALEVSPAPGPESSDQVVESAGAQVFLEPNAATSLDDKILDATVDQDGSVEFSIGLQAAQQNGQQQEG